MAPILEFPAIFYTLEMQNILLGYKGPSVLKTTEYHLILQPIQGDLSESKSHFTLEANDYQRG